MTERETLKLALEALQKIYIAPEHEEYIRVWWPACEQAIPAIKEALAQSEQEPVATIQKDWKLMPRKANEAMLKAMDECSTEGYDERLYAGHAASVYMAAWDALPEPKQEQEPVVWMYQDKSTHEVRFQKHMRDFVDHSKTSEVPLYSEPLANHELQCVCGAVWCGDEMVHLPNKAPMQRKPLTDEEIILIVAECASSHQHTDIQFARAIEAAHGIKGEA